jgi:hypothetical protein
MLSDDYFRQNHRIKGKIDKHFAFIRTELSPRDTRTMATLADNTYKLASGDYGTGKEDFLAFIRKYS